MESRDLRFVGLLLNVFVLLVTLLGIKALNGNVFAICLIVGPALLAALLSLDEWLIWVNLLTGGWFAFVGVMGLMFGKSQNSGFAAVYVVMGVIAFFLPVVHQYFKNR